MTTSLERADQIVQLLTDKGVRATTDVSALNLPAVLVNLPTQRRNDLACGVSVTWALDCIAPAPTSWDRTAWAQLEALVEVVEACFPIERSQAQAFQRPGAAGLTSFPSYQSTFTEAL
jgi:hypothetical protein